MRRRFDLAGFILFRFLGGVIIFMLVWGLLNSLAVDFFDVAIQQGGADRAQGAQWLRYVWTFAPALMLTMLSMHLLARAVFESKGGAA